MTLGLSVWIAGVLIMAVVLAGTINGVAGFGFAMVGTMTLAAVIDPATAVVFMIVPILTVNLSLVGELSVAELDSCARRFGPLVVAALLGTIVGMIALGRIPDAPLRVALGLIALGFVVTVQPVVPIPGLRRTKETCFVESMPAMLGVGTVSGVLFGGTNVGVQLVAYVRSCDLSHGIFVGVVAMIFLGLNAVRVGLAGALQLYPGALVFGLSIAAAVPAYLGVAIGKRLRHRLSESQGEAIVHVLLTVIGVRLVMGGLGIV